MKLLEGVDWLIYVNRIYTLTCDPSVSQWVFLQPSNNQFAPKTIQIPYAGRHDYKLPLTELICPDFWVKNHSWSVNKTVNFIERLVKFSINRVCTQVQQLHIATITSLAWASYVEWKVCLTSRVFDIYCCSSSLFVTYFKQQPQFKVLI